MPEVFRLFVALDGRDPILQDDLEVLVELVADLEGVFGSPKRFSGIVIFGLVALVLLA